MGFENLQIGSGTARYLSVDLGHTNEDGITITYDTDIHMHMVGKFGSTPVKASLVGRRVTVELNLAEITLENFEKSFAGSVLSAGLLSVGGTAGEELTGGELVVIPNHGNIKKWTFKNAVITSSPTIEYSAQNEQILNVVFTALVAEDEADADNLMEVS